MNTRKNPFLFLHLVEFYQIMQLVQFKAINRDILEQQSQLKCLPLLVQNNTLFVIPRSVQFAWWLHLNTFL